MLVVAMIRKDIFALITEMVGDQDDLGAKIEAQGDIVRKLKAEKADKAKVTSKTWQNCFLCQLSCSG